MDCPHVPEMQYADFSLRLHGKGANQGLPLAGSIELTRRCNLRCAHCCLNLPLSAKGELDSETVERIFSEMAEAGCLWLLLTGGEPLVREDFTRLYTFAKNKGFLLNLFTNATLVTPEHVSLLKDLKPFKLEVTVYGATEQTYERVTRVRGSFRRCLKGVEQLASTGASLCLKTMALTLNQEEVFGVEALAKRFGATFRFDPLVTARVDGGAGPLKVRLTPEQALRVDMSDPRRVRSWVDLRNRFGGEPRDAHLLFQCGAGINTFYVDAEGALLLCVTARFWRYDLTKGHFREGWEQVKQTRRKLERSRPSACSTCRLLVMCGQCPGWGMTEHGDPEARVEYLCRIAHLRAEYLEKISPRTKKALAGDGPRKAVNAKSTS
jgi:radical SAM protein with 4Fe4S-binding SPASM domain